MIIDANDKGHNLTYRVFSPDGEEIKDVSRVDTDKNELQIIDMEALDRGEANFFVYFTDRPFILKNMITGEVEYASPE